jgi:hypothetical protein
MTLAGVRGCPAIGAVKSDRQMRRGDRPAPFVASGATAPAATVPEGPVR